MPRILNLVFGKGEKTDGFKKDSFTLNDIAVNLLPIHIHKHDSGITHRPRTICKILHLEPYCRQQRIHTTTIRNQCPGFSVHRQPRCMA